ncbi:MAG: DUF502 domain-containing protein [Acidobacteriota bacterium]
MIISIIFRHFRRKFGTGLILVLPLFITLWILYFIFSIIDSWITPSLMKLLDLFKVPFINTVPARIVIPVVGIIVLVLFLYLLGVIASFYMGKRVFKLLEQRILKIPFIKGIYGASKQLLDAFSSTGKKAFRNVVVFEYPRKGIYSLGFLTSDRGLVLEKFGEDKMMAVFLPTTPNPTSGLFILVPRKDITFLDVSIEEGIKMIVSGGLVVPENFEKRIKGG